MKAYLVDAFTDKRFEGNRAGVVFDAAGLSCQEKQSIAAELGASETAFLSASDTADYKVEFFTPTTEIDFCGHATIAAFYLASDLGIVGESELPITLTEETKAGLFPVRISWQQGRPTVAFTQGNPQFKPVSASASYVARALNLSVDQLDTRYPLELAKTGNWHLMVAVNSKHDLDGIAYDTALLSDLLHGSQAVTAHVFCASDQGLYFARNFCPTIGIPEDPATGSAAAAFGAYLARHNLLGQDSNRFEIIQGEAMGRTSRIGVSVARQSGEVEVSGTAVLSFTLSQPYV